MWLAAKSCSKHPFRSILYIVLICIIVTVVNLLIGTFAFGLRVISLFDAFRDSLDTFEEFVFYREFLEIGHHIETAMRSLITVSALIIIACIFIILLIQYLFNLGRGYEVGVLRLLGLSKKGVWLCSFLESTMLTCASFALSLSIIFIWHRRFSFALLGIDSEMEISMAELFCESLNFRGLLPMVGLSATFLLLTAVISCLFASIKEPLRMMRDYKKG